MHQTSPNVYSSKLLSPLDLSNVNEIKVYYENDLPFEILKKNFDPPYTIFDVGANKGQYCNMVLNYLSNDDISIHCFEPCSYTFSLLKKNTKL